MSDVSYTIDIAGIFWYVFVIGCAATGAISWLIAALLITSKLSLSFTWRRR